MRFGRSKRTATAVAVAVVGGLLGTAPGAVAASGGPGTPTATTVPDRESDGALPPVWPRPQTLKAADRPVPLGEEVTLLAAPGTDPHAVEAVRESLRAAGVRTVHTALPGRGPLLRFGGSGAQEALSALRAPENADLPAGGYRIAVGRLAGRDTVALDGTGDDGLFHAAQTLRQLIRDGAVAGVVVRDWPGTAVRGMTEGFYGRPWSREQRLAQLDFMGRTKQNRYLYAPGDDPFRQSRWREPYPAELRAGFRELAERARRNHVTLAWAVAPAQSMCLASDDDIRALKRKVDAMWALGVRAFQLQFQDVSYSEWHCDRDEDAFGSGPEAAAAAQARLAGELARHLAERHPGAVPLTVMPTEYHQKGATAYRRALAEQLDGSVQVAWTGVGVVPRTITGRELAGARAVFRHPLVTMDNYPVNDYAQDRIFLGPYTGREPAVATGSAALLANAMEQATASRIPLFTAADYAWNPKGYRPQESWEAAMTDLAGGDPALREAVRVLAGNHASSILGADESAYLQPLMAGFWRTRTSTDAAARDEAAGRLRAAFTAMRQAPQRLAPLGGLGDEVAPWLDQLARYGRAGELAVDTLNAQARGDGETAWRASLALAPVRTAIGGQHVTVGKGVLDPFLDRAAKESAAWTGADRRTGSVTRTASGHTVRLDRTRPVEAVTAMAEPGTDDSTAVLEAHVPGEGWRRLGPLAPSGWTQQRTQGLRADALRITGAPGVHALVPWFADEPQAGLALVRGELDAPIGGGPQRTEAYVAARRPDDVHGTLTAKAPKGITVAVPKEVRVPRGARTAVPVEVTVPPGTPAGEYQVPFTFAGEERTLTVRAFPRTGGPDLLRTASAASSGDETPDFPASAASDGDPGTRWSSPVEDGAWWQAELPAAARVGQVVLHWQDAYAARYRIQVSADGRTWRTAATVRDGRGARETVRMDAPGTRFLRVQGDARATRFGYSLWSVETYAVTD
ncbi:beta-N-acetylglucosaminidase domain-containing protein [Streptomyces sp. FIT100]|uniref:beta-N-acetylglucosaminidase domain-containing protein n=1 Tax=Streptomyces sp. FIT100 TaxID=2837956 RepID=UPI0021C81B49|nr:beta-N-acetylglucosaminidase domain-containing protein [Streptomyces sp. FIT100]UUN26943.1 beta-N-acetylglucosaminidase domain-containing protein [Streptomyces sp. FIT100]